MDADKTTTKMAPVDRDPVELGQRPTQIRGGMRVWKRSSVHTRRWAAGCLAISLAYPALAFLIAWSPFYRLWLFELPCVLFIYTVVSVIGNLVWRRRVSYLAADATGFSFVVGSRTQTVTWREIHGVSLDRFGVGPCLVVRKPERVLFSLVGYPRFAWGEIAEVIAQQAALTAEPRSRGFQRFVKIFATNSALESPPMGRSYVRLAAVGLPGAGLPGEIIPELEPPLGSPGP